MLTPTLQRELTSYGIGERLRALRLRRKLGLVELGTHTGLSPALLSKLERGLMFPTLPTLLRISLVFGVGLDHFFAAAESRRHVGVVRAADRRPFLEKMGGREPVFEFECLDYEATERKSSAFLVRFLSAAARPRRHEHAGAEFIHVLTGRLALVLEHAEHVLEAGDSIYFDSAAPHGYRRASPRTCEAVVVVVP